jgi:hypothetical protein
MALKRTFQNLITILFVLISLSQPAAGVLAASARPETTDEQAIKASVDAYINLKYVGLKTLTLQDYSKLAMPTPEAKTFFNAELDKQAIEIYHASRYQLQYVRYQYFLDFQQISSDAAGSTATVSMTEGHNVIFKVSNPAVSSMRNLKHTIVLGKLDGNWLIISDSYNDYLQKVLKMTHADKDSMIRQIDTNWKPLVGSSWVNKHGEELSPYPAKATPIPVKYNRKGAVGYAERWAFTRNPAYSDYTDWGGDCTNFVSQALHEGSAIPETASTGQVGSKGWYYSGANDRAAAWTDVSSLYDFTVKGHFWEAGPEGVEQANESDLDEGDLIQYEWGDGGTWNHTVMVVWMFKTSATSWYPLVAGHSDDVDNYPFEALNYAEYRFIHITGF